MEFKTNRYRFICSSPYDVKFNMIEESENFLKIGIAIRFPKKCIPEKVTVQWTMPCADVFSHWNPSSWFDHSLRPDWDPVKNQSRSVSWAPVQCHLSLSGRNKATVALKDILTPLEIISGVYEEDASIHYKFVLFTQPVGEILEYETQLMIDNRDIPFYDAVYDVQKWWSQCGYPSVPMPEKSQKPMYSTWYAYHQNLDARSILDELGLAKEMGMETVIIDDGWQTEDNSRGYAYCGDWEPAENKIPEMKAFVDEVHGMGMRCMLWYCVPFIGKYSKLWGEFLDKFLNGTDKAWSILDPRYPDVRRHLASVYEKAVREWNLDGLKLDFIDSFELYNKSNGLCPEMDYESLEDGIYALLQEIKQRLDTIKPGLLIEFRQNYMGPLMRTCANMLRVADCPDDALKNRVGSINLRLISGASAVHSDMLMWNTEEPAYAAALQFINVMFSVPQISVRLTELPAEHKRMLGFYLDFWNKNRECLLNGKLCVKNPEANYSIAYSKTDTCIVAVSYSKNSLEISQKYDTISFINGSWDEALLINNTFCEYKAQVTVYTCTGEVQQQKNSIIRHGYNVFQTPKSGLVEIKRL